MEVVAATPNGNGVPPFHNHDVHEWSHIDSLTGVLERARLETDNWAANTNNSSHKYGKVVDSRARSNADGAVQQRARRQLEVFQSSVPGGRLQVIKSHSVSTSRWTSKSPTIGDRRDIARHFGDLELSLNPLDISSQKSKATVGRSVGRRPPSRPRGRDEASPLVQQGVPLTHRVSRLCHQIHENAVKQTFGKYRRRPPIHERESGDGVEIVEIESVNSSSDNEKPKPTVNGHTNLIRTRSTSSEDLHLLTPEKDKSRKSIEDLEDLEQLQNWRRTSKIRRSLQFPKQNKASSAPKPPDLPENTGSVRKIREDLETGRRLSAALRGNNVDLEALDQILQSISSSSGSDKNSTNGDRFEVPERDSQISVKKEKRNSFVTVESLQEVRGRLRRTSSPTEDIYKVEHGPNEFERSAKKDEETDDGIVTEENSQFNKMPVSDNSTSHSRVRSYVYGMEAMINKKPMLGTGSLESRTSKQLNGTSNYRNEDWYNRRKSYGFEQVHNHQDSINSMSKNKSVVESSTDSGICRSSEIMLVPALNRYSSVKQNNFDFDPEKDDKYVYVNNKFESDCDSVMLNVGSVKRYTSIFEQKKSQSFNGTWNHDDDNSSPKRDFGGTTITIPIVSQNPSCKTKIMDENAWTGDYVPNGEIKRHSIAVDESKYVTQTSDNKYRRTSLAINYKSPGAANDIVVQDGLDDDVLQGKKQKKVEFCKTEVHFAAESGRVNIVATDEKPPPTNNFRRRRRNSAALYNQLLNDMNKNGLPVLHFGDSSYEKDLLGVADQEDDSLNMINDPDTNSQYSKQIDNELPSINTVTVSTNQSFQNYHNEIEDEQKENVENETPKGILKNKPIKPKPYLLGDNNFFTNQSSDNEENGIWGVKLKPVQNKSDIPMWRSTVTLKNTLYDKQPDNNSHLENYVDDHSYEEHPRPHSEREPEFQKLLKNLRPTRKQQNSDEPQEPIRIVPSQTDARKPFLRPDDDVQKIETKGYSTRVNIGGGEATVIEDNGRHKENSEYPTWPRRDDNLKGMPSVHLDQNSSRVEQSEDLVLNDHPNGNVKLWQNNKSSSINGRSPVVLRKTYSDTKKQQQLKTAYNSSKLSSPFLVGQNVPKNEPQRMTELSSSLRKKKNYQVEERRPTPTKDVNQQKDKRSPSPIKQLLASYSPIRQKEKRSPSPSKDSLRLKHAHSEDHTTSDRQKSPNRSVLRNPRKSELAYFGIKTTPSPKPVRKTIDYHDKNSWNNKPDLLQHYTTKENVKYKKETQTTHRLPNRNNKKRSESPIYENVDEIRKYRHKTVNKQFDSSILDELTKAADQILQAVNDYAEDAGKYDTGDSYKTEKLDTISETKSWKQESSSNHKTASHKRECNKPKLKHTSSTSSVESVAEHRKSSTRRSVVADEDKHKRKPNGETLSSRAATKARRLQRASSREALLQSHGSSSEDLPISIEVAVRKPRLVRKTKSVQVEPNKFSTSTNKKGMSEERIPIGALPEIRHKTAVSTIRSTAEKSQSRERAHRSRAEESRKKPSSKKEILKSSSTAKTDRSRSITTTKDPINHRISTANIKKCNKSEVSTKH